MMLVCGCAAVTSSPPVVTRIPRTDIVVSLHGPDAKGHYRYSVADGSKILIERFLGPVVISKSESPEVIDQGAGRYRIDWGPGAATVIDTANREIISDSNLANSSHQPY